MGAETAQRRRFGVGHLEHPFRPGQVGQAVFTQVDQRHWSSRAARGKDVGNVTLPVSAM
jgi:hypothetical protein